MIYFNENELDTPRSIADIREIEAIAFEQRLPDINNTYQLLEKAASCYSNKIALKFVPNAQNRIITEHYSYQQLLQSVTQVANMFLSKLITSNDVVSIILPNIPQMLISMIAAEAVAIANPISPALSIDSIAKLLKTANSRFLVTTPALLERLVSFCQESCPEFVFLIAGEDTAAMTVNSYSFIDYKKFPADKLSTNCLATPADVCALFHTSGTTDEPKLVEITQQGKLYSAWCGALMSDYRYEDVILCALPFFHVAAPTMAANAAFLVGAEVVLVSPQGWMDNTLIANIWSLINDFSISSMAALSIIYKKIVSVQHQDSINCLRHAISGTAVDHKTHQAFKEMTGITIQEIYGMTESSCVLSSNIINNDKHLGSMGIPYPYTTFRIININSKTALLEDCQTNETGMVAVQGPGITKSYRPQSLNDHAFLSPDWLNTFDMSYQDNEGYFHYVERFSNLINRNGVFVSSKYLEDMLITLPDIAEAAVIAKDDQQEGQVPVAFVSLATRVTPTTEEIYHQLKEKGIESSWLPTHIHIINDMPVNGMGKIIKPQLTQHIFKQQI